MQKAVVHWKNLGDRLVLDISLPSTPTIRGKKHWLLVMEDSTKYVWSYVLKEKLDLAGVMMDLIKNLKMNYNIRYNTCTVIMQVRKLPS